MRNLSIAYGSNRQAKIWVNKTISFADLKERLKVTIRTPESAEEYARMSKAQRDAAKDHGGFVAGVLEGGVEKLIRLQVAPCFPWMATVLMPSFWTAMKLCAHIPLSFILPTAVRKKSPESEWSFRWPGM